MLDQAGGSLETAAGRIDAFLRESAAGNGSGSDNKQPAKVIKNSKGLTDALRSVWYNADGVCV